MKVGIGLPNAVRGVDRAAIVDWAREADQAGFSSLGTFSRTFRDIVGESPADYRKRAVTRAGPTC